MSARSKIFAYNLADALTSETYPSGRIVTTGYDGANRTLAVTGNLGGVVTKYVGDPNQQYGPVNYWPHGEPYYYSYGNGLTHAASFNARLQPTESYDALNNTNSSSQMLFVSCPNWGDTSNPGVYDLCPHPSAV